MVTTPAGASVFLLSILVFLYRFLVQGTLALVWLALAAWLLWLAFRLVRALERIADAQQRLATVSERELGQEPSDD